MVLIWVRGLFQAQVLVGVRVLFWSRVQLGFRGPFRALVLVGSRVCFRLWVGVWVPFPVQDQVRVSGSFRLGLDRSLGSDSGSGQSEGSV